MKDNAALERRYRRLLAWYPADYRREYGHEIVGVLLAAAREGQRYPRFAERLDLVGGGLRARIRSAMAGISDADWREILAVYSIAAPVLLVLAEATWFGRLIYERAHYASGQALISVSWAILVSFAVCTVLVMAPALVALRYRRGGALLALLLALLPAAWFIELILLGEVSGLLASTGLALLIEAVALAASPGPRRGLAVLTAKSWLFLGMSAVAAGLASSLLALGQIRIAAASQLWLSAVVILAGAAAAAAGIRLTLPRRDRWGLVALLGLAAYPEAVFVSIDVPARGGSAADVFAYLPAVALLAGLAAFLTWRLRSKAEKPAD